MMFVQEVNVQCERRPAGGLVTRDNCRSARYGAIGFVGQVQKMFTKNKDPRVQQQKNNHPSEIQQ